jgi:hypothetical protein
MSFAPGCVDRYSDAYGRAYFAVQGNKEGAGSLNGMFGAPLGSRARTPGVLRASEDEQTYLRNTPRRLSVVRNGHCSPGRTISNSRANGSRNSP